MHGPQCRQCLIASDEHADFDFAGGDGFDVHAGIAQRLKHFLRHAGLPRHAQADDGKLGHVVVMTDSGSAKFRHGFAGRLPTSRAHRRAER